MLAKGYYHTHLEGFDTAVPILNEHVLSCRTSKIPEALAYVARRRGQWDRSDAYSTKPCGWIRERK